MNNHTNQSNREGQGLARTMNLFDVVCLGINSIVGAGIFLLPGQLSGIAGSGALWVFPLCGALCFAIALCFAEMGGIYNKTGGAYLYAKDALGPFVGFLVGWMMWFSSIIGWASVASGFGLYLKYFLPRENVWLSKVIITLLVAGLGSINYFGVKPGARTINFFTVGKLLSLCIFIGVGVFFIGKQNFAPFYNGTKFNMAAIMALYAYTGFEYIVVPAGEMQHPQKYIPRVLLSVLAIVTFLYVTIQFVAMGTFPGLAASDKPLADAARYFMGSAGGFIIGIGALLSIAGINAAIALTGPRSLYVLSGDGFFPRIFSQTHPKYHTPYFAIILNTVLTIIVSLTGSFHYLIAASVMVSIFQYIPTCLAVIILRKHRSEWKRSYRIPGGYTVPVFALIICGWLLCYIEPKVFIATALAILASLPFYFKKWYGK